MRRLAVTVLLLVALTGCGAAPARPAPAFNATDVMFLQMSLEHIRQGELVTGPAADRARSPRVRALVTELHAQWQAEAATMQRWLAGWRQPPCSARRPSSSTCPTPAWSC